MIKKVIFGIGGVVLIGAGVAGYLVYKKSKEEAKAITDTISDMIKNATTMSMDDLESMCDDESEDTVTVECEDFFAAAEEA